MQNIRNCLWACVFLLVRGGLPAQESLSLVEAVELGLQNSYQVAIAERNIEIAENNNDWGRAGAYPNADLTFDINNGFNNQNNPASFLTEINTASSGFSPGFNVGWTLFDGSRVKLTKEQLEQLEVQSRIQGRVAVEATVQNIILAYYQALLRQEQVEVIEEVLELSRDRIAYEEVRKEYGQASTFDLLQTQDAFLNDSTTYLAQLNEYRNAMRNLNLAMRVADPEREFVLSDSLEYVGKDYNLGQLQNQMLANNTDLRNLQLERELARIDTRLQETERFPEVRINAGGGYNLNQTFWGSGLRSDGNTLELGGVQNRSYNFSLGLSATYNLYNGGNRNRDIQNAQLREINAQYDIENTKRNLFVQLRNTLATYNNQKKLVEVTGDLVDNARRNLEIAGERFRGGLINSFDYRTIQVQFINASQSQLQQIFNLKSTETDLLLIVGELIKGTEAVK